MIGEHNEADLRAGLMQQVLHDLSLNDGLTPFYRSDVTSTTDFESRLDAMPLVTIWNEHIEDNRIYFSISINDQDVQEAFELYMSPLDPWLPDLIIEAVELLKKVSEASIRQSVLKTGLSPSALCAAMHRSAQE